MIGHPFAFFPSPAHNYREIWISNYLCGVQGRRWCRWRLGTGTRTPTRTVRPAGSSSASSPPTRSSRSTRKPAGFPPTRYVTDFNGWRYPHQLAWTRNVNLLRLCSSVSDVQTCLAFITSDAWVEWNELDYSKSHVWVHCLVQSSIIAQVELNWTKAEKLTYIEQDLQNSSQRNTFIQRIFRTWAF